MDSSPCFDAAFPEWVEHISNTEKGLHSEYTMSCAASGKPKPHIHWLKNGKKVIFKPINLYCHFRKLYCFCSKILASPQQLRLVREATVEHSTVRRLAL